MFVEFLGEVELKVVLYAASGLLVLIPLFYFMSLGRAAQEAALFALPRRRFLSKFRLWHHVVAFLAPKEAVHEHAAGQIDLESFAVEQVARNPVARGNLWARGAKRTVDILASLGLLVFMAPLLLLTALAIKIESRGPVLYTQIRVGRNGRLFQIYKFRSMAVGAEQKGAQWAASNDARVTGIGRIIRKTRIDEIPQALNILKGDMSFVGPRPERPEFTKILNLEIPHYDQRHLVKPGLTGWAQINYQYGASVEDARHKLTYDLYYIKHFSFLLDLFIIIKTVRVALFGIGSR